MLSGLARGDDVDDLMAVAAPGMYPTSSCRTSRCSSSESPALDLASPADGEPLEGLHERYLPELTLRGVEHNNSQYALCAAA